MKTLLVAWPGPRARAYLQMMCRENFRPCEVILLGDESDDATSDNWGRPEESSLDLSETLRTTLHRESIPFREFSELDINSEELAGMVRDAGCDQAIFSGGGILKEQLLEAAPAWIHVHPGRLPDMRGSTCIYYALLLEKHTAATAFAMTSGLDEGRILAQMEFPPPGALSEALSVEDFDHSYDAWMRATALIQALSNVQEQQPGQEQDRRQGQMFYIIHPVLKHLAILSCAAHASSTEPDHVHSV